MAPDGDKSARRWPLRLGIAAAIVVVLVGAVWLGGPPAVKAALVWWLERDGRAAASIEEIDIDLSPLAIELRGVKVVPTGGGDGISFQRAHVGLGFRALFDQRLLLRDVALDGLVLPLRREDDTWRAGGFPLPGGDVEATEGPAQEDDGWRVGLSNFVLTDARIRVQDRGIDETLNIERLALGDIFTWSPETDSSIAIAAALAGADLRLLASGQALAAPREGQVRVQLEKLPLAPFAPLLEPQGVNALSGTVSLDLNLSGSRNKRGATKAEADGSIIFSGIEATMRDGSTKIETLRWNGKLTAAYAPKPFTEEIVADGALQLIGAEGSAATSRGAVGQLDWNGKITAGSTAGSRNELKMDGAMKLAQVEATDGKLSVTLDAADWNGSVTGAYVETGNELTLNLRGTTSVAEASVRLPGDMPRVQVRRVEWQGQGDARRSSGTSKLQASIEGSFVAEGPVVDNAEGSVRMIAADRVSFDARSAGLDKTVSLREVSLRGLTLRQRIENGKVAADKAPVTLRETLIDEVSYSPADGLRVGETEVKGAQLAVVHLGDGRIADILPSFETGRKDAASDRAFPFSFAGLKLGGDSRIAVIDRSQGQELSLEIAPVEVELGEIASARPQAQTPVKASLGLQGGGTTAIQGTARPLAEALTGAVELSIDRLEVPTISPFARRHLGLTLRTGQLAGKLDINADSGALNGQGSVTVRRLEVEIANRQEAQPLISQIPVSLENALGLLKGGDGVIRLEVPISGNVSDPQFDLSNIINQAIGRAVGRAALTTVKVLFPLGALAEVVLEAGKETRFAPLEFQAGSAAVSGQGKDYLEQLGRLLRERPGIQVALCGKATPADREALLEAGRRQATEQGRSESLPWLSPQETPAPQPPVAPAEREVTPAELEALASARAESVRSILVSQGISDNRLLQCAPAAELKEAGQPRVEVTL